MKASTKLTFLMALALMISSIYSCKKEDREVAYEDLPEATPTEVENIESADDNEKSDAMYTHVYTVVHTEVSNVEDQAFKTGETTGNDPCAAVTYKVDSTAPGKINRYVSEMTIDYGSGCTLDDRVRKGKIIITKTGKNITPGTKTTIKFDNFYIDGNHIEGLATMENKGYTNGSFTMQFDLVNGKMTASNGDTSRWETHRTMDVFPTGNFKTVVKGTSSGVNHKGVSYSVTCTKDLIFERGCKHVMQGTLLIKISGKPDITIDYGDGTCDDKATVTMNGVKYKKTME